MNSRHLDLMYGSVKFTVDIDDETYKQLIQDPAAQNRYAEMVYHQFFSEQKDNLNPEIEDTDECHSSSQVKDVDKSHSSQVEDACEGNSSQIEDDGKLWTDNNVMLFISLYHKNEKMMETTIKKKVWQKIAQEIEITTKLKCSQEQAENKWKALKKKYVEIKQRNKQTGKSAKPWRYYLSMDEILGKKPEVIAPATCSSLQGLQVQDKEEATGQKNEQPKTSCFQNKRKQKSDAAERRHQEKMKRIDDLNKTMNRLVDILEKKKEKEE